MSDFEAFKQTFYEECEELLLKYAQWAGELQEGDDSPDTLNGLFRAVHSMKAGAATFKFGALVNFSHTLETSLDYIRDGKVQLGDDGPALLVRAGDVLATLFEAARDGSTVEAGLGDEILAALEELPGAQKTIAGAAPSKLAKDAAKVTEKQSYKVIFQPYKALYESANEPQLLLSALTKLGPSKVTCQWLDIPTIDQMDPLEGYLTWTVIIDEIENPDDVSEVFEFVEGDCRLEVSPYTAIPSGAAQRSQQGQPANKQRSEAVNPSIRVDLTRVDRLVDMVGELVIAQAMAIDSLSELVDTRHIEQLRSLEDLSMRTRQLQEGVMAIRMQPLSTLFSRYPRIVRDLSAKLKKSVRLELRGETTEVDKTIIEELADPLTHIIRNSMDHGIEMPDERSQAGKPSEAIITLSAEQRNGRILIRAIDNGRGLNREKILAKAIEKGIVSADESLQDEEIDALIFAPGFSTASEVSDVSGRGVGMDVVRRSVQKLGGRITVESQPGVGTTFTMALPLTLAVMDGMLVQVGSERYIIPLTSIIETVVIEPGMMRKMPDGTELLSVRGTPLGVLNTYQLMGVKPSIQPTEKPRLAIITETEFGRRVAVLIDDLLGQQQVVIKNLEANFRRIEGIAGSAILGDGRVRLILDVDAMAEMEPIGDLSELDIEADTLPSDFPISPSGPTHANGVTIQ